jgi:hypothetical protein
MIDERPPSSLAALALEAFGVDAQLAQAQEELAELIVVISHLRRGRIGHPMGLRDEIADVEIMLEQLRYLVDDDDAMDRTRARKRAKCLAAIQDASKAGP